ncbi:MAG: hypothetical protein EOO24_02785, partial [Comamonadaceae bacterium]
MKKRNRADCAVRCNRHGQYGEIRTTAPRRRGSVSTTFRSPSIMNRSIAITAFTLSALAAGAAMAQDAKKPMADKM